MKIRTITTGISLKSEKEDEKIKNAAESNRRIQSFFEQQGYEVQETRITTNSWETYLHGLSAAEVVDEVQEQINVELDKEVIIFLHNLEKIIINSPERKEIIHRKFLTPSSLNVAVEDLDEKIIEQKHWHVKKRNTTDSWV